METLRGVDRNHAILNQVRELVEHREEEDKDEDAQDEDAQGIEEEFKLVSQTFITDSNANI